MTSKIDLENDIAELNEILEKTKSPRIVNYLKYKLNSCTAELSKLNRTVETKDEPNPEMLNSKTKSFVELQKFGWEDAGYGKDKVSVYIMSGIDGIGNLEKDQVCCDFTSTSFDLKIYGLNGKNYRLIKRKLDKEIDAAKSSIRVKQNRLTISLIKKDKNATWMNLTEKNAKASTNPASESSDPSAGIMDMMKNMYNEGDDDMKRTIAKAWTESRNKSPGDMDMPKL